MENNYEEIQYLKKKGIHCQAFHKEILVCPRYGYQMQQYNRQIFN